MARRSSRRYEVRIHPETGRDLFDIHMFAPDLEVASLLDPHAPPLLRTEHLEIEPKLGCCLTERARGAARFGEHDPPVVDHRSGEGLCLEQGHGVGVLDRAGGANRRPRIDDRQDAGIGICEPVVQDRLVGLRQRIDQAAECPRTARRPGPGSSSARVSR